MQSEVTTDITAALVKAQGAMKTVKFDRENSHYRNKYASLASFIDTIRGPLSENGLAYTQTTEIRDGGFVLVTTLRHVSGQWIGGEYPLPVAAKPQELGSAITYARRYALSALLCIAADEDDDAEGARTSNQVNAAPAAKESPVKPQLVAPPVDPETGECSPHKITADDAIKLGSMLVSAVKLAKSEAEVDQWLIANDEALVKMAQEAPKVHGRVMANVSDKMQSLTKAA